MNEEKNRTHEMKTKYFRLDTFFDPFFVQKLGENSLYFLLRKMDQEKYRSFS